MKYRQGFVSNSSSSSFCVFGTEIPSEEFTEEMEEAAGKLGLSVKYPPDSSRVVGIPWRNIRDEETGGQFKIRIKSLLKELLGRDVNCTTYEDSWYNG